MSAKSSTTSTREEAVRVLREGPPNAIRHIPEAQHGQRNCSGCELEDAISTVLAWLMELRDAALSDGKP